MENVFIVAKDIKFPEFPIYFELFEGEKIRVEEGEDGIHKVNIPNTNFFFTLHQYTLNKLIYARKLIKLREVE